MSNNLKSLRKEADVTTRDMKKYTGISNSITTYLEMVNARLGKRT